MLESYIPLFICRISQTWLSASSISCPSASFDPSQILPFKLKVPRMICEKAVSESSFSGLVLSPVGYLSLCSTIKSLIRYVESLVIAARCTSKKASCWDGRPSFKAGLSWTCWQSFAARLCILDSATGLNSLVAYSYRHSL